MMQAGQRFDNVQDEKVLGRIMRSFEITTINRFEYFEAVNKASGHRYQVRVQGKEIRCSCPDSHKGNTCKHEIAVSRDLPMFGYVPFYMEA